MSSLHSSRREGKIPSAVITRLPIYYRYLTELPAAQEKISSSELGEALDLTAAQIRSDLSYFGSFGLHGYGYNVNELRKNIKKILGLDRIHSLILLGAGNLGRAIACYQNFYRRGFEINAIFDSDPALVGELLSGCRISSIDKLEEYLTDNHCDIAVITTPKEVAQLICDRLVKAGVKAIWNFAPISLKVPDDVIVEHTHLTNSLLQLSFRLTNQRKDNER
ncbi:MAG: redox-sensing transcriptional repressor Rex [Firmicutes bacterium]|nr:redox-sensing transcriptional repressor Rex [Bacillota bacterium]